MTVTTMFMIGLSVTAALAIAIVSYIRPYLKELLIDLCGTATRAAFWTAFSTVVVALTPILFALHYRPTVRADGSAVFEIGSQLELALTGQLLSVLLLALVLAKYIPPREPKGA